MPARTRASHDSPASACAGGSARLVASVTVMAAKSPALTHSPAATPQVAMTRPPMAGPMAKESENDTFSSVLPGLELAVGLERGGDRPARQRAPDEREDPVRRGQDEHEREPRRRGEQRQRREDRGLGEVERRQHAADAEAVELRGGRRSDEGGDQQRAQPQRRRGQSAVRVVEDQQAERDGPEAPTELVERVGGGQAAEAGMAQGAERDHSGGLSDRVPDGLILRRDPDTRASDPRHASYRGRRATK